MSHITKFKRAIFENCNSSLVGVAKSILDGYRVFYESPHAYIPDREDTIEDEGISIDFYQEFDGEERNDGNGIYDWVEFLGKLISGERVLDNGKPGMNQQVLQIPHDDLDRVKYMLLEDTLVFVPALKRALENDPSRARMLPIDFLADLYHLRMNDIAMKFNQAA